MAAGDPVARACLAFGWQAFALGAFAGAAGAIANGADILAGALLGGVSGLAFAGVNGVEFGTGFGAEVAQFASFGAVGGVTAVLAGGKFANGAGAAAFASLVSSLAGPGGRSEGAANGDGGEPSTPVGGSRALTEGEAAMAKEVFGDSLDTDQTLVHRKKYWIFQRRRMAMAPNGDIYFHPNDFVNDFSALGISGRSWFVHELTHVWQHQSGVNVALKGALNRNYNYAPLNRNVPFSSYGVETQGSIVEDYYRVKHGYSPRQGNATLDDYRAVLPF